MLQDEYFFSINPCWFNNLLAVYFETFFYKVKKYSLNMNYRLKLQTPISLHFQVANLGFSNLGNLISQNLSFDMSSIVIVKI